MSRNSDGLSLGDVTSSLLSSFLNNKTTKSSQINVVTVYHRAFYTIHKFFNDSLNTSFVHSGLTGDVIYDISFCHNTYI